MGAKVIRVHNLGAQLTPLIGRDEEVRAVTAAVHDSRLVTLIGSGGVGKTRLAFAVAEKASGDFRDGAWVVELASVADIRLLPAVVASALNVPEQPGRSVQDSLVDSLRGRELLLLLDNCEHLIHGCAELVERLLRECWTVSVLATSRQALRLNGERVWRVPSLRVASADLDLSAELPAAVQLFVSRAQAAVQTFTLDADNAVAVAQITRELDGVPLAIELAAGRLPVLSPRQIAARLDHRLQLLRGGARTVLPRQQTLRGTIEWSYSLLSSNEQTLFRRLAVFAGGWTLEAAEHVCSELPLQSEDVLDLLGELVDKSLVSVDDRAGTGRYRMLETIREFAWEKLREASEDAVIRDRHRDWCITLSEQAEPYLYRAEQLDWLAQLDREHDNLRAGLAWSVQRPNAQDAGARLAGALGWFWYLRGQLSEGRSWLERFADGVDARALVAAGWMYYGHSELARAAELFQSGIEAARASGDTLTFARALLSLSFTLRDLGEVARSAPLLDDCVALAPDLEDAWPAAFARYLQGILATFARDNDRAKALCTTSARMFRKLGDRLGLSYSLTQLGEVACATGHLAQAAELYEEALVLSRELGNRRGICFSLNGLAVVANARGDTERVRALKQEELRTWCELGNTHRAALALGALAGVESVFGEHERAARMYGAAEALRSSVGGALRFALTVTGSEHVLRETRPRLGLSRFKAICASGAEMTLQQVTDFAVAPASARAHGSAPGGLSPRELDIAVLVARGLSNRAIAERLIIAPRTAETHVGNILGKLNLHTRAELAAWVVSRGLSTGRRNAQSGEETSGCPLMSG